MISGYLGEQVATNEIAWRSPGYVDLKKLSGINISIYNTLHLKIYIVADTTDVDSYGQITNSR